MPQKTVKIVKKYFIVGKGKFRSGFRSEIKAGDKNCTENVDNRRLEIFLRRNASIENFVEENRELKKCMEGKRRMRSTANASN